MQLDRNNFSGSSSREYSRESRSTQSISQGYGRLIPNAPDFAAETYATGQQMHENMEKGNEVLLRLSRLDDDEICDIINTGRKALCDFVCSSLFALLFDNRRLKAAFFIQVRFLGDWATDVDLNQNTKTIFGDTRRLDEIFDQVGSITSLYRCLSSICGVLIMACQGSFDALCSNYEKEGKSREQATDLALQQVFESPHNVAACELLGEQIEPTVYAAYHGGNNARPDAPGANTKLLDVIADWFENTLQSRERNQVFFEAFKAEVLSPSIMTDDVKDLWDNFKAMNDIPSDKERFSLWDVADFFVTCRLQRHRHAFCGSNIFVAALSVLSGAISNFIDPKIGSVFKFVDLVQDKLRATLSSILKNDAKLCLKTTIKKKGTIKDESGQEKRDRMGRACSNTKVTDMVLKLGAVRNQNGKSAMIDSRLTVAFWMLSLTEDLKKDVRENIQGLPKASLTCSVTATQGRIGVRRIQILSFQTAPFAKKVELLRTRDSHLIEKKRRRGNPDFDDDLDATRTTGDNTEKPMRDFVGGAIFNTLLYPLAGRAFIDCIQPIIDKYGDKDSPNSSKFNSNSAACYNIFLNKFEERARSTLDWESVIPPQREGLVLVDDFTDELVKVLKQQFSFAMRVSNVTRNCGILWEALQLSFAIVRSEEDPEVEGQESIYAKHKVPDRSRPYSRKRACTPTAEEPALEFDDDDHYRNALVSGMWDQEVRQPAGQPGGQAGGQAGGHGEGQSTDHGGNHERVEWGEFEDFEYVDDDSA